MIRPYVPHLTVTSPIESVIHTFQPSNHLLPVHPSILWFSNVTIPFTSSSTPHFLCPSLPQPTISYLLIHPSILPSNHYFISSSIHLFIYPSIYVPTHSTMHFHPSWTHPSFHPLIHFLMWLPRFPLHSPFPLSINPSICLSFSHRDILNSQ